MLTTTTVMHKKADTKYRINSCLLLLTNNSIWLNKNEKEVARLIKFKTASLSVCLCLFVYTGTHTSVSLFAQTIDTNILTSEHTHSHLNLKVFLCHYHHLLLLSVCTLFLLFFLIVILMHPSHSFLLAN